MGLVVGPIKVTMLMLSVPPATMVSACPVAILAAAVAIASSPDAQNLLSVRPGTVTLTRYCVPESAVVTAAVVKFVPVAPAISVKVVLPGAAFCH